METRINPNQPVVTPVPQSSFGISLSNTEPGIEGDFGAESSRIPYLSIGQRTSDITEKQPEALGAFVYAGKVVIPKPVVMALYNGRQYYRQNTAFERNPTSRAKTFETKAQVLAAGGNLDRFVKAGLDDNNYVPEIALKVVIMAELKGKKPWASHEAVMSYPVGTNGTVVVPLLWILRGVAYGEVLPGIRMIDRALREEGKEIGNARFAANVVKRVYSANSTFVPTLDRLPEDNPIAVVQVLHKIFAV